jgi:penicillin-binding protein-related factor A (putative recombinase)
MGSSVEIGKSFEDQFFRLALNKRMAVTRIPDGCKRGGKLLFPVKTPWDFVLSFGGKTALIDTKTSKDETFAHSKITIHQVTEMGFHVAQMCVAGYVIWFRHTDQVIFISAPVLLKCSQIRGSFSAKHPGCKILGNSLAETDLRKIFE